MANQMIRNGDTRFDHIVVALGKKSWFSELDDSTSRKIRFVDNNIVCAEGIGEVLIHRNEGDLGC